MALEPRPFSCEDLYRVAQFARANRSSGFQLRYHRLERVASGCPYRRQRLLGSVLFRQVLYDGVELLLVHEVSMHDQRHLSASHRLPDACHSFGASFRRDRSRCQLVLERIEVLVVGKRLAVSAEGFANSVHHRQNQVVHSAVPLETYRPLGIQRVERHEFTMRQFLRSATVHLEP